MELNQAARRLRVYHGEANRMKHTALHEVLIRETRGKGSGGTDPARSGDVPS